MASTARQDPFRIVAAPADGLCLDFANTRYWRGSAQPTETLSGFGDLLAWCEGAGVLDPGGGGALRAWGDARRHEADRLAGKAVKAREAIYRLFGAVTAGDRPDEHDLERLNRLLAAAPERAVLADDARGWRLPPAEPSAASLLAPVLWSAGDLLAGPRMGRVRRCANDGCLWLFLDDSKGGTRRWCAMSACGNRAKARRHYLRKTAGD
ncbi:CGNR zinc finger domain-containing protein [Arenibaculum sp.]|uniref:CGNR zinc finger domain-containing protein n=1 Tax=Arenibaculum sp. TaxID=2865862 RepID=UPI002E0D985A|nr:ABATE domain-containing protein [Arenibaculum sp.]